MSDELVESFRIRRDQYVAFTSSVVTLVGQLLSQAGINVFAIESRTKHLESLSEKLSRDEKVSKYEAIEDVTDLSGLRIISYLQEDCIQIGRILRESFSIDESNSISKGDVIDPDKFGYLSDHYVISFTSERSKLPEFSIFDGMKAEIQVRTLLQHTWAAIDHKLRYKSEAGIPRELRRRLFRISALLESADDEFSFLNDKVRELRETYSTAINQGMLNIPVNTDSISTLMEKSDLMDDILSIASGSDRFVDKPEDLREDVVIKLAEILKIETIEDLVNRAKTGIPQLESKWPELVEAYKNSHRRATRASLLRLAIILGSEGRQRDILLKKAMNPTARIVFARSNQNDK